jgi:hypothetical protein
MAKTRTAKKASKSGKSGQSQPRPEGELRQSQMVTTYGPGALVDLVEDAILIPGLEYWSYGAGAANYEIEAVDLARNLRRRGLKLSESIPFRSPPVAMSDEQSPNIGIKAIEFPSWFLCTSRSCERLIHKRDTIFKGGERKHRCQGADGLRKLVPVRFATACRRGHLDDFPWEWFVHAELGRCDAPELRLIDRGSGDLSDVIVKCENCPAKRSMADARGDQSLPHCGGHRPWLGAYVGDPNAAEACTEIPKLLVRTASGGYFSQVESALTIPRHSGLSEELNNFLVRHDQRDLGAIDGLEVLKQARRFITVLRDAPDFIARLSDAELWDAIERFRALGAEDEGGGAPVRESEYTTILGAPIEELDPLYKNDAELDEDFHAAKPAPGSSPLPDGVRELVLIERLREVRVLTGFTRIEPPTQNIYGEFDLLRTRAAPSLSADWLPATEIRGEGFFVELDLEQLGEWETRPAVIDRRKQHEAGWKQRYPKHHEQGMVFPGIRFYLLHTLAHLLITQVSLECGYAASAIRERIYCNPPDRPGALPMAGFLLSTGSSGSEGTLGGLVDQGRRLQHHLDQALRRAKLCSHDPVCGRSQPDDSRPGRALLGAACHGCLFIAECSCERANQYLDRALVVPTLGVDDGESLAFFASPTL